MQTLRICIEHLLVAETQTHDNRERIYHEICAGRKDVASGFQDLLANDRHGAAQRIGFLVGYATAFRMHSDLLTQARNTYGGHEFAGYYHSTNPNAPSSTVESRSGLRSDLFDHSNVNSRTEPATNDINLDREGWPTVTVHPAHSLTTNMVVGQGDHVETNGHGGANGHNGLSGSTSSCDTVTTNGDTVMTNGNGVVNGNGASGYSQLHIAPHPTGLMAPLADHVPHNDSTASGDT